MNKLFYFIYIFSFNKFTLAILLIHLENTTNVYVNIYILRKFLGNARIYHYSRKIVIQYLRICSLSLLK